MVLFQNCVQQSRSSTKMAATHSEVALLLEAALIQVSDYRILGASGFFDDTLASNNILFGVMSCDLSLIFDRRIICKIVKYIDQLDNISWRVHSVWKSHFKIRTLTWPKNEMLLDVNA